MFHPCKLLSKKAVVIGGGVTGTLTALRLLQRGWQVTLLEARHIGSGSSSRSAAAIRQQFSTPETVLGMRFSVDFYKKFVDEVGGCDSPIVQSGYLFLLKDGMEAAKKRVAMQKSVGLEEVEILTSEQIGKQFPYIDTTEVAGGTWCPTDGFLRPEVIYNETAIRNRALGGTVRQNAEVMRGTVEGDRLVEVVVSSGRAPIQADLFIDATNAWSPRLAAAIGASELPIAPTKRYLWFLRRGGSMTASTLAKMPMVIVPTGAYCHPDSGWQLLTGWAHSQPPQPYISHDDQDVVDPEFSHKEGTDNMGYKTWGELAKYIPELWEFDGITATTSGFYAVSPDHNPFLGYDPKIKNLIRLVAFSGHGVMFAPFTALVAEHLAEAGKDVDEIEVYGMKATLKPFQITRQFHHSESMVI